MGPKLAGINGVITSINGYYKWIAKGYNPTYTSYFAQFIAIVGAHLVSNLCVFGMSSRDLLERLVFQ